MNAIETKELTKKYQGFSLDHLTLALPQGCIMGLIGANGAGKSTTIKLILNLIHRDEGTVKLLGKDNREDLKLTKEDIGVVLDEVGISGCLTTMQVGKVMKNTFHNWDQKAYENYLRIFGLPEKKKFSEFSKGMKMKLGIAVALSHHAKLLILDEATSGLDPVVRDELLDIFCEFTREENHSILISSHIVSDLEKICDYIAFLHQGKLLLLEEKDVIKARYGLLRCSPQELAAIKPEAVRGKKETAYGMEAVVLRDQVPGNLTLGQVDIETLFIFMTKEERGR